MNVPLWWQRCDAITVTLYSAPMDATQIDWGTLLLEILAVATVSVAVSAEHSIDPNNPNGWSNLVTVTGSAVGNFPGVFGGDSSGTTQPVGPYVRFKAVVTVTSGAVVWSASAVLR